ncbi:SCP2 sterol-binding domain-containing protein [Nocardioides sp. SOB77]|uniref:SCP2 sterol-binding domain-containing protein n=1 Tax=Nocardioides oceani TaxID=3058369 RepID=A0ABT8FLC4_9ACTN|nr:SCP2 sterol-binding domain-containing protein [Nocardioides oceani]MDN4175316.1 SCP2 sterol-binding domain-containing protein [Nocardioides oceani]
MTATLLDKLRTADRATADRFFAETPAEELVAAVAAADDDQLLQLIGQEEVRAAAVPGILRRMEEYADADRLAAVSGMVRFDLRRNGRLLESHAIRLDHGTVGLVVDPEAAAGADVVLTTSLLRFVRLVSGQRNAGLEYLCGGLDVEGDALLALSVGAVFRVPGHTGAAVDPTALDPDAVARAVGEASTDHLRRVMAGGFRPIVLEEVFRRLPSFVDGRRAARLDLTVGFRLGGGPGEPDRYVVALREGAAVVTRGDEGHRDATIVCEAHDFLRLATGHLGAVAGVLKGRLGVKGDKSKALQLASVIQFPAGADA